MEAASGPLLERLSAVDPIVLLLQVASQQPQAPPTAGDHETICRETQAAQMAPLDARSLHP